MLGMGPVAEGDQIDGDLINAGKIPVTELPGASYFHHADSFAIMRGGTPGHLRPRRLPGLRHR
jgi:3-oxoadipate CoA-transferase beta subunit